LFWNRIRSFIYAHDEPWEPVMDNTTLLIILLVVLVLFGGGWYGRGRWY